MNEERFLIGIDLSTASKDLIELLIDEASDCSIFENIVDLNSHRPEILSFLLQFPETPDGVRQKIAESLNMPVPAMKSEKVKYEKHPEERSQSMLQKIQRLGVSEKILLALRGGKEVRSILLRDPNKEVSLTVLENPKITETEIEVLARSRSVSDEALRKITKKREWMKNYSIVLALVTNPKTPAGIAVSLVSELKTKDLAVLERNKNVTEGVRITAKKLLKARKGH
ncbi:MAG: hypothetical protein AB1390_01875 [Nitrospirota bacterium]